MRQRKTDLALEIRESFPGGNVEIEGVSLEKTYSKGGHAHITTVKILNGRGSQAMGKPIGNYITIESEEILRDGARKELVLLCLMEQLKKLIRGMKCEKVLVVGLGNRQITSDSLGPDMIENIIVTGEMVDGKKTKVYALAPGVMGQTGMETVDILKPIVEKLKPDFLVVVDALAARSMSRLCTTVQLTDTGISPGSGIGNQRKALTKKTLGVPVIAIGIPTVVDAKTIISDHMEMVLQKQGYSDKEIDTFLCEVFQEEMDNFFVTPKNIDESVQILSQDLSYVINHCL